MIKVNKETLAGSLMLVGGVVKKNSFIPILGNIHVKVKDGIFRFRLSDSETQVQYKFTVEGEDEMDFCVPAHLFISTISKSASSDIELQLKERDNGTKYLNIKSGKGKFKIEVINSTDYIFNEIETGESIKFTGDNLFPAFKRAFVACDPKDRRPAVNGCAIVSYDNCIHITGSHQAIMTKQIVDCEGSFEQILLSDSFSSFISGLKYDGRVEMFRNDNWFGLKFENYIITTKIKVEPPIIQDKYFAEQRTEHITVNRLDLESVLKRISSFTMPKVNMVTLDIKEDELVVSAENSDHGHSASESVSISVDGVDPIKLGVNYMYLLNCLMSLESEYISMYITGSNEKFYVQGMGSEVEYQRWLLMPMRRQ